MKINRLILVLSLLAGCISGLSAQNSTISPYSRFGYGLMSEQANAAQRSMGGVGYAMRSGRQINFMNPASYAAIDTLTFLFDMAVDAKSLSTTETTADGQLKGKNFTGGLDYITMQFPITRYGGASIGLIPYSEVGYKFGTSIVNGHNSNEGSGSVSQLYLGLSARPFKGFTAGVNVSYMFGTLLNDVYVNTDNSSSLFERVLEIRDYNLRFGLQYGRAINADNELTVGVVYSPKKSFHGHSYGVKYDINADTEPDTIGYSSMKGNFQMAETWGAGICWEWRKSLTVEADFTYQPWKGCKFTDLKGFSEDAKGAHFNDRWRVAIGAAYVPKPRGSWLQRVSYRLGAHYCNDYIMVGDNSVRERGISLGFGLPAPSTKTIVNLAFEYRQRDASPQPLVKENYFLITLGVNFNELWFWQNKIH